MGSVPIWAQWSILGAGVMLCPLLMLLLAVVIGWLWLRKLWGGRSRSASIEPRARAP
jgi:hypothetical protein